jgi:beta-glucosidase
VPDERRFPADFRWGAATAAHQVEGDNTTSDWWEWEHRPGTPVREPSGRACEHYTRYTDDIRLLAHLGLNTYRFSVEWARVEPEEGRFDDAALDHYRAVTDAAREAGVTPMVTLHHFTLPLWLARSGGWLDRRAPDLFARYCARVVGRLGDGVEWWSTINEPGNVAVGGYLGLFGWPPGTRDYRSWERAAQGLVQGHLRALDAVKSARPDARVGATHGMQEWESNDAGCAPMEHARWMFEDYFLNASHDDDFVGVQTYTRVPVVLPAFAGPPAKLMIRAKPLRRALLPRVMRTAFTSMGGSGDGVRRTQMGYEFRPEAIGATLRRAAAVLPGKDLVVTEHGIATSDDAERIEFVRRGLEVVHDVMSEGVPVRGYVYWSLLDNFEWAHGYRTTFGLVHVDRTTLARTVRPSGTWLGQVARAHAVR